MQPTLGHYGPEDSLPIRCCEGLFRVSIVVVVVVFVVIFVNTTMNMTNDNNNTTMKFLKKYFYTLILLWTCLQNIFRNMFQLFVYYKCKQTVRKTTLTCYIFLTKYFSLAFSAFWPCKDQKIWPSHMNLGKTHPKKYFYDEKKISFKISLSFILLLLSHSLLYSI